MLCSHFRQDLCKCHVSSPEDVYPYLDLVLIHTHDQAIFPLHLVVTNALSPSLYSYFPTAVPCSGSLLG